MWAQSGDSWTKSNKIDSQKAYYIFTEFECSFNMDVGIDNMEEFAVQEAETDQFVLKRIPQNIQFETLIDRCGLATNSNGRTTWIQRGGSPAIDAEPVWSHPFSKKNLKYGQGVWIYPQEDCSISLNQNETDDSDSDEDSTGSDGSKSENTTSDDSDWDGMSDLTDYGYGDWYFDHVAIETDTKYERPERSYEEYETEDGSKGYRLNIDGNNSVCGTAKWMREFENSDYDSFQQNKFIEIDLEVRDERLLNDDQEQIPQKIFVEIDGERIFERDPSPGSSYSVREQMYSSGNDVEIGVEDLDSDNCFRDRYRTTLDIEVETSLESAY